MKNLKYGENIATILRQQLVIGNEFRLWGMDVSEKAVLDLCDYFLGLPVLPTFLFLNFTQSKPATLAEAVVEKFKCAGAEFESIELPEASFDTFRIQVREESGKLKFDYSSYN